MVDLAPLHGPRIRFGTATPDSHDDFMRGLDQHAVTQPHVSVDWPLLSKRAHQAAMTSPAGKEQIPAGSVSV